jgi:hypothetical protein
MRYLLQQAISVENENVPQHDHRQPVLIPDREMSSYVLHSVTKTHCIVMTNYFY